MAMRRNPFVKMGRPAGGGFGAPARKPRGSGAPGLAMPPPGGPLGAPGAPGPTAGFNPAIPSSAFKKGGAVNGHTLMPHYHDDPNYCKGGKTK